MATQDSSAPDPGWFQESGTRPVLAEQVRQLEERYALMEVAISQLQHDMDDLCRSFRHGALIAVATCERQQKIRPTTKELREREGSG